MTIDDVEREMLNRLNKIDFEYYERVFHKSEWETIKWIVIDSYSGCGYLDELGQSIGYSFSPKGCELQCGSTWKKFNIKELKELFESQKKPRQLSLF